MTTAETAPAPASVELYWLPLGAGDRCVRGSGRLFEAVVASRQRRPSAPLFHTALEIHLAGERFTIEMAPAWDGPPGDRGVVGSGAVGLHPLGRSRWFRYEVRRWRGGAIPDLEHAVRGPQRCSEDGTRAAMVLDLVPAFPLRTWGRDELATGEMWNSNSLISWLLARSGHHTEGLAPPDGGRAPGWSAGLVVAARQTGSTPQVPAG
jgi:hypothetical protein